MTETERRTQTRRDATVWATSALLLGLVFAVGFLVFV